MRPAFRFSACVRLGGLILLISAAIVAQIPTPRSVLGFNPTDDKTIADWTQITDYFAKLDKASNRVTVREIGRSTLGKPLIVAFISSAGNIRNLDKLKRINQKLADPRTITNTKKRLSTWRASSSNASVVKRLAASIRMKCCRALPLSFWMLSRYGSFVRSSGA